MSPHRYDRTGDRLEDTDREPLTDHGRAAGIDACRQVIEQIKANRPCCPFCGGQVKGGWTEHPSCRRIAEANA